MTPTEFEPAIPATSDSKFTPSTAQPSGSAETFFTAVTISCFVLSLTAETQIRLYVNFVTRMADKGTLTARLCNFVTQKQTEIPWLVWNLAWAYVWKY